MSGKYGIISTGNTQGIAGAWPGNHAPNTHDYGVPVYSRRDLLESEIKKVNYDIKVWEGYTAACDGYMPLAELQMRFNHLKQLKFRRRELMAQLIRGE